MKNKQKIIYIFLLILFLNNNISNSNVQNQEDFEIYTRFIYINNYIISFKYESNYKNSTVSVWENMKPVLFNQSEKYMIEWDRTTTNTVIICLEFSVNINNGTLHKPTMFEYNQEKQGTGLLYFNLFSETIIAEKETPKTKLRTNITLENFPIIDYSIILFLVWILFIRNINNKES